MSSTTRAAALPEWLSAAIKIGLIGGIVAIFIGLQGMLAAFSTRNILGTYINMGHMLLLLAVFVTAYLGVSRSHAPSSMLVIVAGTIAGLIVGAMLVLLVLIGTHIELGLVLVNAVPALYESLTFHQGLVAGSLLLLVVGAAVGAVTALVFLLPPQTRRTILIPLGWVVGLGLMQDLVTTTLSNFDFLNPLLKFVYLNNGLSIPGAIAIFVVMAVIYVVWAPAHASVQKSVNNLPPAGRSTVRFAVFLVIILFLLTLPSLMGLYLSQVLDDVGLYVLMGLGLNIVVGFAGLLDLGYAGFFAIGAYTAGVLTSPDFGHPALLPSWWLAVPVAIFAAMAAGVLLGIPVLRMRGDYLAIVTLGFAEIIRLLLLSDFLKPFVGGAQGILDIAKPVIPWFTSLSPQLTIAPVEVVHPEQFYYVLLAGCLLVAFVAMRVKDSRLGRAWMAMREDEDVAQAMGINLVATKLMAFGMGASFGGLGGAIFGAQLGSIFPQSFTFIVSVNILSLIIIGGMGNIPGVILGAFALVGLPELLREFSDYRFLFYGAALVLMMLLRPEGLIPEARRRMELEESREEEAAVVETEAAVKPAS